MLVKAHEALRPNVNDQAAEFCLSASTIPGRVHSAVAIQHCELLPEAYAVSQTGIKSASCPVMKNLKGTSTQK